MLFLLDLCLHYSMHWRFYKFQTREVLEWKWCWIEFRSQVWCWWWVNSFRHFAKIFWGFAKSLLNFTTPHRANWLDPVFMDLGVFFLLPFSIESIPPERTLIWVSLVVSPTVWTLEHVWAWFSFLCFESRRVCFFICLATPPKFTMVFWFVRTVAFDTLRSLYSARECYMTPLPAVLALGYTQIHVSISNSCNILADIEASVD